TEPVSVGIGVALARPFRVYGEVRDEEGKPLAEAKISVAFALLQGDGYGDTHSFTEGRTDGAGHYEIRLGVPWIRAMRAEKDGYVSEGKGWGDGGDLYSPGKHDFTLRRQEPSDTGPTAPSSGMEGPPK
ncbi:MAG TPA: hypothetical protein VM492_05980, partial [Sumerlaeia bacterium]|nr:hypothetical protein [Sumerlaeia bacterium]